MLQWRAMRPRPHAGLSALNEKATQCCQEDLKKKKTKTKNQLHDPVLVYLYLYFFLVSLLSPIVFTALSIYHYSR